MKRSCGGALYPGMTKPTRKLALRAETIRTLDHRHLGLAQGGSLVSVTRGSTDSSTTQPVIPSTSIVAPITSLRPGH